jgi:hypothetical protein
METWQAIKTTEGSAKEQLLQAFDEAYEQLITAATKAAGHGIEVLGDEWGPREILAHIVGWAAQATEMLPQVIAGLPPQAYVSELQHATIDDAFNAAFITLLGNQTFEQVLTLADQTHQKFVQMLKAQDESIFVPDNPVYLRMKRVIDHYLQHTQELERLRERESS